MTSVMVVNSEPKARKEIINQILPMGHDFKVVAEAFGGEDGVKKFNISHPDIIIADISQRGCAEMIERLRKNKSFDAEVMVVTANSDFSCVKRAFKCGVASYILQPVVPEEFVSELTRIKDEQTEKRKVRNIIVSMLGNIPKMRNDFVKELFTGRCSDKRELEEQCRMFEIKLPDKGYSIVCMKADKEDVNDKLYDEAFDKTVDYCKEQFSEIGMLTCKMTDGSMAILVYNQKDDYELPESTESQLYEIMQTVKERFELLTSHTVSLGYSFGHYGENEIPKAYDEARRALSYRQLVGKNVIIDYGSVPSVIDDDIAFSNGEIEKMIDSVRKGDSFTATGIINNFFDKIRRNMTVDIGTLKNVILEMVIILLRVRFKNTEEIKDIYGRKLVPSEEMLGLETLRDIEEWTYDVVLKMFAKHEEADKNNYVIQAIQILNRDYGKPITVETVSKEMHISAYYLMHIFKTDMNITFNQYLTKIRVEKAMEMLRSGRYKVYEVANAVGYEHSAYFSYVFKKVTGKSPKKVLEETLG